MKTKTKKKVREFSDEFVHSARSARVFALARAVFLLRCGRRDVGGLVFQRIAAGSLII